MKNSKSGKDLILEVVDRIGLNDFLDIGIFSKEMYRIIIPNLPETIDPNVGRYILNRHLHKTFPSVDADGLAVSIGGSQYTLEAHTGHRRSTHVNVRPGSYLFYTDGRYGMTRIVLEIMDATVFGNFSARSVLASLKNESGIIFETKYNPVLERLEKSELIVKHGSKYSKSAMCELILGEETEKKWEAAKVKWKDYRIKVYK